MKTTTQVPLSSAPAVDSAIQNAAVGILTVRGADRRPPSFDHPLSSDLQGLRLLLPPVLGVLHMCIPLACWTPLQVLLIALPLSWLFLALFVDDRRGREHV